MNLFFPFLLITVPSLVWTVISKTIPYGAHFDLTNKNITLLVSHPDDEVMFFGPSLALLTIPQFNNTVSIVSLSAGNAEGLGDIRKFELVNSAWYFKIPPSNVVIINDDKNFPDSMDVEWDSQLIVEVLNKIPLIENTNVIITFDDSGVSNHPNHISLSKASSLFVKNSPNKIDLWKLQSVSIFRKYLMFFDSFISYFIVPLWEKALDYVVNHESLQDYIEVLEKYISIPTGEIVKKTTIVSRQVQYTQVKSAMVTAHESQMKWYRYGWVLFSRYLIVNDLVKE